MKRHGSKSSLPVTALIGLLAATSSATGQPAAPAGQPTAPATPAAGRGYVAAIRMIGPTRELLEAKREHFAKLLADRGYQVSNCQFLDELQAELDALIAERYPTWDISENPDIRLRKATLNARCAAPQGVAAYVVRLTLDVDADLDDQRRVTVHFFRTQPADTREEFRGGYAHRPFFEKPDWNDMMDRALTRAIDKKVDEPPAIHLRGPAEVRVGDTVVVRGDESWDTDGDAFELRWSATMAACVRDHEVIPLHEKCPDNAVLTRDLALPMQAGKTRRHRVFAASTVGSVAVTARARVGDRTQGQATHTVDVRPRRPRAAGARGTFFRVPDGFLVSGTGGEVAHYLRPYFTYRVGSRTRFGYFEELRIGGSLGVVNENADAFVYDDDGHAATVGVEIDGLLLDNMGKHGIASSVSLAGGPLIATRNGILTATALLVGEFTVGYRYGLGYNYVDRDSKLCVLGCAEFMAGFSLLNLFATDTQRFVTLAAVTTSVAVDF